MQLPITLMYAGIFAIFALVLSFRAGSFRATGGISVLYGDPANMELAQRVRVHQNFLEYVPIMLILMGLIEANGGASMFLYVVGDLLIIARIAHAIGLKHDNMAHKGRAIGAGGTALITLVSAAYGIWLSWPGIIAGFS
ncbi:MAG: MAPEG family protein [Gammaproteobacteria bacterium]|nr:MAPEG family protein [Gammaproteobacteria bacterium]